MPGEYRSGKVSKMKRDSLKLKKKNTKALLETPYLNVFDLQYDAAVHYYSATRRSADDLTALKSEEDFRKMLPDAVTCIVVIEAPDKEPRLVVMKEFRYPVGRFLLSVPSGLCDKEDLH